jgi:predicted anti-sigma-YlaC factor YlaD
MTHARHALSCREMAEFISDYIDGDLREDLRSLIESHRGDCPPCEAFIRTLARTVDVVRAQPREPLPPALKRALVQSLREARGGTGHPSRNA